MNTIMLRELELSDMPKLNEWRNDKEIIDKLCNTYRFICKAVDEDWYNNYMKNRDKNVRLAIIHVADNQYIGNVNLTDINPIDRTAAFSIFIGDSRYHFQGIGFLATSLMIEHGFNNLNLNRISLYVLVNNELAINLYKKVGFVYEGLQRQVIFKNGKYHDLIMMSLLRDEFQELKIKGKL